MNKQLERCLASINASLSKHKLILGVDDRGKLSCHKVNLCFIYFDPSECVAKLEAVLAEEQQQQQQQQQQQNGGAAFDREAYLRDVEGFEDVEVVVAGAGGAHATNAVKLNRKKVCSAYCNAMMRKQGNAEIILMLPFPKMLGARGEAVPALHPALVQGLPAAAAGLAGGGPVRQDGVRGEHEPEAPQVGSLPVPGTYLQ